MERPNGTPEAPPSGPPPLLLWIALILLFLILVAGAAGLSYFASGQRLASLIPYVGITVAGLALGLISGSILLRRHLPRRAWLWTSGFVIIGLILGSAAAVWAYRDVLPPRYQEQFITEVPFLRALLPPTPEGGTIPTVAATSAFSVEDLLSAPVLAPTTAAPTETPAPTLAPTATATMPPTAPPTTAALPTAAVLAPTAIATVAPQQLVESFTAPPSSFIYGFTHITQGWNNCGPANVTMALSYFGWREDQEFAASYLKPYDEDKNVSPTELVNFVNDQSAVRAIVRIGGDLNMLKQFIVNGIPVIIERSYTPEGFDWIGHYQTVVGYDDSANSLFVFDSYLGTGAGSGLPERYDDFDAGWQAFNRVFIAIYEPSREAVVQSILGERANPDRAAELAFEVGRAEARADVNNPFPWFNMGTALTKLGRFEEATRYFDEATRRRLPFRMLWYQFYPYEAYFEVGRFDDVLSLVEANLNNGGDDVEETHYWQGRALAAQGRNSEASAALQRALARNPRFNAAQTALASLS